MEEIRTSYSMNEVSEYLTHHGLKIGIRHDGEYSVTLSKGEDEYTSSDVCLDKAWCGAVFRYEDAQMMKTMDAAYGAYEAWREKSD